MQPSARTQAVIELLEQLQESRLPADVCLRKYTANRRYIGSKDRHAISQLFYAILRHKGALAWHSGTAPNETSPRALMLAALCLLPEYRGTLAEHWHEGTTHGPAPLSSAEQQCATAWEQSLLYPETMPSHARHNLPDWLYGKLEAAYGEGCEALLQALATEATLDLRSNSLRVSREKLLSTLQAEGIAARAIARSPWGISLPERITLPALTAYQQGWCEPQDRASQWAAEATGVKPGQHVLDYCAGAGGKTLALAAMMQNKGHITACDISETRLKELQQRCKRAGVTIVTTHLLRDGSPPALPYTHYDHVITDVPCSGTGTWRRNPDARWRYSEADINHFMELQRQIVKNALHFLKPGGRYSYITCSLLPEENETQAQWIKRYHPDFSSVCVNLFPVPEGIIPSSNRHLGLQFLPHALTCDGLYIVVFDSTRAATGQ